MIYYLRKLNQVKDEEKSYKFEDFVRVGHQLIYVDYQDASLKFQRLNKQIRLALIEQMQLHSQVQEQFVSS